MAYFWLRWAKINKKKCLVSGSSLLCFVLLIKEKLTKKKCCHLSVLSWCYIFMPSFTHSKVVLNLNEFLFSADHKYYFEHKKTKLLVHCDFHSIFPYYHM